MPTRRGVAINTGATRMGTKLQLSCTNGNTMIGASELTCLPSGNWSAPFPVCESKCYKTLAKNCKVYEPELFAYARKCIHIYIQILLGAIMFVSKNPYAAIILYINTSSPLQRQVFHDKFIICV